MSNSFPATIAARDGTYPIGMVRKRLAARPAAAGPVDNRRSVTVTAPGK